MAGLHGNLGWCGLVLLAFLAFQNDRTPGVEAASKIEVSTALDSTKFMLQQAERYQKYRADVWKKASEATSVTDAVEKLAKSKAALQIAQQISGLLTAVSAAGVLANFIFTFFLQTDPNEALHKRFDEVPGNIAWDSSFISLRPIQNVCHLFNERYVCIL